MKNLPAIFIFCLIIKLSFSQTYDEIKKALPANTLTLFPTTEECMSGIQIVEDWMQKNPHAIPVKAYHDLQNYYYVLAAKDSSIMKFCYEKCIEYNLKYAELVDTKRKYSGYWNATICYSALKDCPNTLKYLALAKKFYNGKKKYWDHSSEKIILSKICVQ